MGALKSQLRCGVARRNPLLREAVGLGGEGGRGDCGPAIGALRRRILGEGFGPPRWVFGQSGGETWRSRCQFGGQKKGIPFFNPRQSQNVVENKGVELGKSEYVIENEYSYTLTFMSMKTNRDSLMAPYEAAILLKTNQL